MAAALVVPAGAAERSGPVRIAELTPSWGLTPGMAGVRDGLVELGYRENKDFVIGTRFTQGDIRALGTAARELVALGPDLIVAAQVHAALAAQKATSRIPIVFVASVGDPVKLGLVQSYARPGGNVTGVTDFDLELAPKRLEMLRDLVPGLRRVLLPYDSADPYTVQAVDAYRDAARRLGLELVERPLRTQEEAQAALAGVRKGEVDGLVAPSSLSLNIPGFVLDAGSREGIPTMFFDAEFWVERGALAGYGPVFYETGRQGARLVHRILQGADPGKLPVETNPRIELGLNLKVAERLGLRLPAEVLYRADRIIR